MKKFLFIFSVVLFGGFVFAQTEDNQLIDATQENLQKYLEFHQFSSCENIDKVVSDYIELYKNSFGGYRGGMMEDVNYTTDAEEQAAMPSLGKGAEGDVDSSSNRSSSTNLQKANVDEPELIKSDGKYIYYYNQKDAKIYIVSSPLNAASSTLNLANADIKTIINLPSDFYGVQMFVHANRLIILGTRYANYDYSYSLLNRGSRTFLAIYDIQKVTSPKLLKFSDIDGYYTDARMIGNKLYLVSQLSVWRDRYVPYETSSDDLLPKSIDVSNGITKVVSPDCKQISYVLPSKESMERLGIYPGFTIVSVVDVVNTKADTKMNVLMAQAGQIHMTKNSLYIVQNIYHPYRWSCGRGTRCIMPWYDAGEDTLIHKFAVNGFSLNYQKSNMVPGNLLNQYSMDEDSAGNFRILTQKWNEGTNLYALDANLSLKGKLEKIEPEEQFKSSRYIGDKLYLVTFEQIDPLFVVDISNISKPKIIGELKVPGYSTYLHPMGGIVNNTQYLIGLGYNTTGNQWGGTVNAGVKLSLYKINYTTKNVSEVDSTTLGGEGSRSEALENPRMFVMDAKNTVTLPLLLADKTKKGQNCSIEYDENGNEKYRSCRDIEQNLVGFVGLKSFAFDKTSGIEEVYSRNFKDSFSELLDITDLQTREISNMVMRVGYAGDSLYLFNNYFAYFTIPTTAGQEKTLNFGSSTTTDNGLDDAKYLADQKLSAMNGDNIEEVNSAISFLYENKITKFDNYSDFMPLKTIKREEAAKMLAAWYDNVMKLQDITASYNTKADCGYTDLTSATSDLRNYLGKACQLGVFKGGKKKFLPKDTVTNGQIITMIVRMLEGVQDESNVGHFADNYVKIANDYALIDGLDISSASKINQPALRKTVALLIYRASKLD